MKQQQKHTMGKIAMHRATFCLHTLCGRGLRAKAQFTQDAEHLATGARKLWNTLWSMGVFIQLASHIKRFACKYANNLRANVLTHPV